MCALGCVRADTLAYDISSTMTVSIMGVLKFMWNTGSGLLFVPFCSAMKSGWTFHADNPVHSPSPDISLSLTILLFRAAWNLVCLLLDIGIYFVT